MDKKKRALGMNPSTARNRLHKNLLFNLAVEAGHKCYRCGGRLTLDTFSIEHIEAWMHAENPVEAYFDLENIAFSHIGCNSAENAERRRKYPDATTRKRAWKQKNYDPAKRREQYLTHGH